MKTFAKQLDIKITMIGEIVEQTQLTFEHVGSDYPLQIHGYQHLLCISHRFILRNMSWFNRCIVFCGVGFGSGLAPKAPGTFGSAFACSSFQSGYHLALT